MGSYGKFVCCLLRYYIHILLLLVWDANRLHYNVSVLVRMSINFRLWFSQICRVCVTLFVLTSSVALLQVDLFFYRDPEEAKDQEEAEAIVATDFGAVPEYAGMGGTDQWNATEQWDMGAGAPVSSVPSTEWAAAQGQLFLIFFFFVGVTILF